MKDYADIKLFRPIDEINVIDLIYRGENATDLYRIDIRLDSERIIITIGTPDWDMSILTLLKVCLKEHDPKYFWNYFVANKHGFSVNINEKRVYDKLEMKKGTCSEYKV